MTQGIYSPMTVWGRKLDKADVKAIADGFANTPSAFRAADLTPFCPENNTTTGYQWKQEVLNRLFQRWRKMGLLKFQHRYWKLTKGAWEVFQSG